MHVLIAGDQGVGKSTLIRRVLKELDLPIHGFETKKEDSPVKDGQGCPVYIYEAGKARVQSAENLVGYCDRKVYDVQKDTFDRFAKKLLFPVPERHIILMDELGIMETVSEDFCSAVMTLLDGNIPVIAAVKNKDKPYLEAVRSHPNCRCYYLTTENREAIFQQVLEHLKEQL